MRGPRRQEGAAEKAQQAQALLKSGRPALAVVWCGRRQHRLALVYDLPGQGHRLAVQGSSELCRPKGGGEPVEVQLLPWVYDLSVDARTDARCACGTWRIDTAVIRHEMALESRDMPTDHVVVLPIA